MFVLAWADPELPPPTGYVVVTISQGPGNSVGAQRTIESTDSPVVAALGLILAQLNSGVAAATTFTGARADIAPAGAVDVFAAVAGNQARRLLFRNMGPSDALYALGADADSNPVDGSATLSLLVGEKVLTDFKTASKLNVYSAGGTTIEAIAIS